MRCQAMERRGGHERNAQPEPNFDFLAKQYDTAKFLPNIPGMGEPPPPPEPLTDEQIGAKVAQYRAALAARWPSCRDYLAGIAWTGLQFRIKNLAKSFLNDVQVILTFHGARGVDWEDQDEFEVLKVQDPDYEPTRNPLYYKCALPRWPLPRTTRSSGSITMTGT